LADRTVAVSLKLSIADYLAKTQQAKRATGEFYAELGKSKQASDKLSSGMLVAGGALAAGFGLAVKAAADFDRQMSHVSAVAQANAKDLDALRSSAIKAGKDTQFSATQAAQAEEELAKAGISAKDIIGGGLRGALDLAAAGTLDLAEAADIAAKAMNTFGLSGKDVPHIADVLAAAANKSATDVHELGFALKMGGLAARNSGLSLEETTGVLAAFADRALVGSDAGTSLKTMLQFLANPTEKASNLMARLGIDVYDAQGNFVGITKTASILQTQLGKLTQEERNAALATIFGSDATRAATVLYELGSSGLQDYISAVNDQGAATETAAKKTDNLAGDLERLKGSLETVAIEAGSGANGGLRDLVKVAGALVDEFGELPDGVQSTLVVLAGVAGVSLLAAGGFVKVRSTLKDTMTALSEMGPAGEKAATGIGKVASVAGKAAVIGTVALVAYEAFDALGNWIASFSAPTARDIDKMSASLKDFANSGKAAGEFANVFGHNLERLSANVRAVQEFNKAMAEAPERTRELAKSWEKMGGVGPGALQVKKLHDMNVQQRTDIEALDKALANLVSSGGATQAKLALDQMRVSGNMTHAEFDALVSLLPQYNAAVADAATANTGLAKGFGDAAANARTMKGSLDDAIRSGQSLIDVFNQLNGAALDVSDAEIAAENAVRTLNAALKESHGSLDITTEKGAAARQALNDLARKGAEAAQAVYNQTGSAQAASAEFARYRQKLIDAAVAAGYARDKAAALADELMQLPSSVPISISVTTHYKTVGTPGAQYEVGRGLSRDRAAYGGIRDFYAAGGMREDHRPQVLPAGAWRTWAEPETGGEAYIPLGAGRRNAALGTLHAINRRFGNPFGGGGGGPVAVTMHINGGGSGAEAMVAKLLQNMQRTGQLQLTASR